ncbi:MAG: MtaA/CmuA family methyltransferase [Methanomassiliicoccus sp.]|nr:MtaA/CmuA family methyltransferase [Methanomassiliicoccus sp.]
MPQSVHVCGMNERERLLCVLAHEPVDRVPVVSPTQTGTVDLMKASGAFWPEANTDPALMFRLSLAAHTVAGLEGCRVPFDAAVDASAFGAVTSLDSDRRQPAITGRPVTSRELAEIVPIPDPRRDGRAPVVLEALTMLREEVGGTSPILCGVVSAFTLACQLRGEGEALMDLVLDPDYLRTVLNKAFRWNVEYAREAVAAGADVIVVVDATASGDILSPEQYDEFARPYEKRLVQVVRDSGAKSILHICGDTTLNLRPMKSTGADGISVDQTMDMRSVKRALGAGCAAVGNVSPVGTLLFHSPEYVYEACRECVESGTDVLAPGCGFAPETPLANMQAMASVRMPHHPV